MGTMSQATSYPATTAPLLWWVTSSETQSCLYQLFGYRMRSVTNITNQPQDCMKKYATSLLQDLDTRAVLSTKIVSRLKYETLTICDSQSEEKK